MGTSRKNLIKYVCISGQNFNLFIIIKIFNLILLFMSIADIFCVELDWLLSNKDIFNFLMNIKLLIISVKIVPQRDVSEFRWGL